MSGLHRPEPLLYAVLGSTVIADIVMAGKKKGRLLYSDAAQVPLSLSLPLTRRRHDLSALAPWVEGLMPDRPLLMAQWRRAFRVQDISAMALLPYVGEEIAGAVQFVRPDRMGSYAAGGITAVKERDIAGMLRRSMANIPEVDPDSGTGQFSLAGAQAKIALQKTDQGWAIPHGREPTTHILKPPIPGMADQDLIEHLTLSAARYLGLTVAGSSVQSFDGQRVLMVERYDRVQGPAGSWLRVHQEDLLQALGLSPIHKYQATGGPTPGRISDLIRGSAESDGQADVERFVQAMIFNWLVAGTDAHAKNYSLLIGLGGTARLAPLYDLNSNLVFGRGIESEMAMKVGNQYRVDRVTGDDWLIFAAEVGVDDGWLTEQIETQAGAVADAFSDSARRLAGQGWQSPLTQRLVDEVALWSVTARRSARQLPLRKG